mgnify:CR=1 FL=1
MEWHKKGNGAGFYTDQYRFIVAPEYENIVMEETSSFVLTRAGAPTGKWSLYVNLTSDGKLYNSAEEAMTAAEGML